MKKLKRIVPFKELVDKLTHEINNPNNYISINVSILQEIWQVITFYLENNYLKNDNQKINDMEHPLLKIKIEDLLNGIQHGSTRIKTLLTALNIYANLNHYDYSEIIDINDIITSSVSILDPLIKERTNQLKVITGKGVPKLTGNIDLMFHVFVNIITNSCEALENKEKSITIKSSYDHKRNSICVMVKDQGCGILAEDLKDVFIPFFTTKSNAGHHGLGLTIAEQIVYNQKGEILIHSKSPTGTTVTIYLPL